MRPILFLLLLLAFSCNKTTENKEKTSALEHTSQTPMMGWSSWNNYKVNINENIIK